MQSIFTFSLKLPTSWDDAFTASLLPLRAKEDIELQKEVVVCLRS